MPGYTGTPRDRRPQRFVEHQGWQANYNGFNWELDVKDRLRRHGYEEWSEPPTLLVNRPFFVHRYKSNFRNPFGDPMELDFYLYHPARHRNGLILECKTQHTPGSTNQKLYFTVAAIKSTGVRGILLLDGTEFKASAIRYCQAQQDDQFLVLTSWDELTQMFNTGQI